MEYAERVFRAPEYKNISEESQKNEKEKLFAKERLVCLFFLSFFTVIVIC